MLKLASPFSLLRLRPRAVALAASLALAGACSGDGTGPGGGGTGGPYDHTRAPGASARDLLTSTTYDSLIVEIQNVQGFQPTSQGLQHLRTFLGARLNKPLGIELRVASSPLALQPQATYSAAQVRSLEQQHRTVYTSGRTLATYLVFLNGEFAGSPNVLGIAYNNTSMAIFEEKIVQNTGGLNQPTRATVEGTVANHEFGHIMGLVNNGIAMQTSHQDTQHGEHCDDPNCLMYYAVRTTDFLSNLLGGMPTLDQDCLDDLRAAGGR